MSQGAFINLYGRDYSVDEILKEIRSEPNGCVRLELDNTGLDGRGVEDLVAGFGVLRQEQSQREAGSWNLRTIVIRSEHITDAGLAMTAEYARDDPILRYLAVGGAEVNLNAEANFDQILSCINSSSLQVLSLRHSHLLPAGITRFLADLDAPKLRALHLNECHLGPESADVIIAYLTSSHCWNLRVLDLTGNDFSLDVIRKFVDTVQHRNFTLLGLNILDPRPRGMSCSQSYLDPPSPSSDPLEAEHRRLCGFLDRNRALTSRVKQAALRCLPHARILLNSGAASDATSCLDHPESHPENEIGAKLHIPPAASINGVAPQPIRPLRFSDLPLDIIHLIIRHTSDDATDLSHSQFARLRIEAEGKVGLGRVMAAAKRAKECPANTWAGEAQMGSREEWLELQGLDRWEPDAQR